MVKSVRLCRTEPAILKEDIIMSKIVNEAKIGHLRSGLLPLLPDVHSESAPHPFIPRHQCPLHISYSEVTYPTADKHLHFLHHSADIASPVSLCKKFQRSLCFVKRLSVYTDKADITILAQTESKKLDVLLCKDTSRLALFRVHFELQPTFQILPAGFQQALCCAFALGKHHNVICIPNLLYPAAPWFLLTCL